jgi:site-specific DNA-methyltransferase (adenine-specific)
MINQIIHGDCFEVLKTIPDGSIDLILTDPPYGLSFMGKNWDHGVPGVQFWIEALRVAKPGAHLFAFGGTRTFHRLAVAIEDAGWEIRDTIMWVYGSGFPKSLDVSKAIDKIAVVECPACNGIGKNTELESWEEWIKKTQDYGGTRKEWERLQDLSICNVCNSTGKVRGAEREVVGKSSRCVGPSQVGVNGIGTFKEVNWSDSNNITAPATPEAQQWQGWGTALKPAFEPIIVARKPLTGTVAENVLQWGTGGINIDGCRVPLNGEVLTMTRPAANPNTDTKAPQTNRSDKPFEYRNDQGRWPANLIHDGSEEVVGLFPYQKSGKVKPRVIKRDKTVVDLKRGLTQKTGHFLSSEGSAARFFYCAKASKSERSKGNTHPTVKPLALMKYLITLGLPPGGTVLDPFCGSGTTALACKELGRNYICIEKELEYYQIACNRLDQPIEPIPDEPIEEPVDNSPLQLKLF